MGGDSPGVAVASGVGRGPALGCAPWGRGLGASRTDWGSHPASPAASLCQRLKLRTGLAQRPLLGWGRAAAGEVLSSTPRWPLPLAG